MAIDYKKVILSIGAIGAMVITTPAGSALPIPSIIAQIVNALGALDIKKRNITKKKYLIIIKKSIEKTLLYQNVFVVSQSQCNAIMEKCFSFQTMEEYLKESEPEVSLALKIKNVFILSSDDKEYFNQVDFKNISESILSQIDQGISSDKDLSELKHKIINMEMYDILKQLKSKILPYEKYDELSPSSEWEYVKTQVSNCITNNSKKAGSADNDSKYKKNCGKLFSVPSFPPNYLPRYNIKDNIKKSIMEEQKLRNKIFGYNRSVCIYGMIGVGKSVAASSVIWDNDIQNLFDDGIHWLAIGRNPMLTTIQTSLIKNLGENHEIISNIKQGSALIEQLLKNKSCLIVLDDVWDVSHLDAFPMSILNSHFLITTREKRVIDTINGVPVIVDLLDMSDALKLFSQWVGIDPELLPPIAKTIVMECGRLPLAISMIGASGKGKSSDYWEICLKQLQEFDEKKLCMFPNYPYKNLLIAISVSMDALDEYVTECYKDLAVFQEDTKIPESVIYKLWSSRNLSMDEMTYILYLLSDKSLLFIDENKNVYLHDLQLDYLKILQKDKKVALHNKIVKSYQTICNNNWRTDLDDGYLYQKLPYHFYNANRLEELKGLLTNYYWLQAKLDSTGVKDILDDFALLPEDNDIKIIKNTILLSAHILSDDKSKLSCQLLGRLLGNTFDSIGKMLEQSLNYNQSIWMQPLNRGLICPGECLLYTLYGHSDDVNAVVLSHDKSKLVSVAADKTIRIWDYQYGVPVKKLAGHTGDIVDVMLYDNDTKIISASFDETIRLWDFVSNDNIPLKEHRDGVTSINITQDGRMAVSTSIDNTVKIWSLIDNKEIGTLRGHKKGVFNANFIDNDTRILSSSYDQTSILWDVKSEQPIYTFPALSLTGSDVKFAVATSYDGNCMASVSDNYEVTVWDLKKLTKRKVFTDHNSEVYALDISDDGTIIASGADDGIIIVWNLATGKKIILRGHHGYVYFVKLIECLKCVSVSFDKTIRVWDLEREENTHTLHGHTDKINGIEITGDGKNIISYSDDNTIKIWDISGPKSVSFHNAHHDTVASIAFYGNSIAATASYDGSIKMWDIKKGELIYTDWRHNSNAVYYVAFTPDKRLVSASFDGTVRIMNMDKGESFTIPINKFRAGAISISGDGGRIIVDNQQWDIDGGQEIDHLNIRIKNDSILIKDRFYNVVDGNKIDVFDLLDNAHISILGHKDRIYLMKESSDGKKLISASMDKVVFVWDIKSGSRIFEFSIDATDVNDIALTSTGRIAAFVTDSRKLEIWDCENGCLLTDYYADSPLVSCEISPDNNCFIAGGKSGEVHILKLVLGEMRGGTIR